MDNKNNLGFFPMKGKIPQEKESPEEFIEKMRDDTALAVCLDYSPNAQLKSKEDIANGRAAILRAAARRSMAKARRGKIVKVVAGVVCGIALTLAIAWQACIAKSVDMTNGITSDKNGKYHPDGTPVGMFDPDLLGQYLNPTDEQKDLAKKIFLQQLLDSEYDDYHGYVDGHSRGGRI